MRICSTNNAGALRTDLDAVLIRAGSEGEILIVLLGVPARLEELPSVRCVRQ